MFDLRQSRSYADYMRRIGWRVDVLDGVYCFSKKIPILGSVIKIQRGEDVVSSENLDKLVRKRRAFMVLIEAKNDRHQKYYLNDLKFRKTKSSSLPSKTVQINLNKAEKFLTSEMHYKTRYNIKIARKKGVVVKKSADIKEFSEFWQKAARKRGMFLSLEKEIISIYKAFGNRAVLLIAYKGKKMLGEVMILFSGNISYYMYAASSAHGNKLFAPTLLVWEALKYSKKKKMKKFDFEGIYDERYPLESWKGFSRFKKSFGGKVVKHPGSIRRFFLPF